MDSVRVGSGGAMKKVLIALSVVFCVTACGQSSNASTSDAPVEAAELDATVGEVVLPFDRFAMTSWEEDVLMSATGATINVCAADKAVETKTVLPTDKRVHDEIYASEHYFGPWTEAQANRWGFVPPMTDADLFYNGIEGGPQNAPEAMFLSEEHNYTPEDEEVIGECRDSSSWVDLSASLTSESPWLTDYPIFEETWKEHEEAVRIIGELSQCLTDNNLVPLKETPWLPTGSQSNLIDEEQIDMAVTVVDCKKSLDFTQRIANVEASLQQPLVEKYSREMQEHRSAIDEMMPQAEKLIAEHPEVFFERNPKFGQ